MIELHNAVGNYGHSEDTGYSCLSFDVCDKSYVLVQMKCFSLEKIGLQIATN